jgi:hypothetical protein
MSQDDIATLYGTTRQTIHNKMNACKIQARSRSDARIAAVSQGKAHGDYVDKLEMCIKIALADNPRLRHKLNGIAPELIERLSAMLGLDNSEDR